MSTFNMVKRLADKQKISLAELARQLDMGENSLYKWKTQNPTVDKLQKVADYFNVSTDYLLERGVSNNNDDGEPDIRIIQRAAKDMTPEQRKKAINLWKAAFDEVFDKEQ